MCCKLQTVAEVFTISSEKFAFKNLKMFAVKLGLFFQK